MSNLITRAISGSVYVALIVLACLFTRIGFDILMIAFGLVGIYEFLRLTADSSSTISVRCGILSLDIVALMSILLGFVSLYPSAVFPDAGLLRTAAMLFGSLLMLYVVARVGFALMQRSGNPTAMLAHSVLGLLYLGIGLGSAILLNSVSNGLVLMVFIFIWLNDTGAYLSGRTFGRHKLCVHLSPKKTWEGFVGGLLICVATGIIFSITGFAHTLMPDYSWAARIPVTGIILPVSVVLFSTAGDLFESMVKRNYGVKDSGNIIPGHGGVLDRIDSMLFAMPGTAVVMLLYIFIAM